eukprot:CAMPEP_0195511426 /NCGR_PEP_ID=MMETSP0794_2-20130614/3747_1 /TAXON_ID=515487 /ORGANISM="Stephanopyxis turris, Strain CCMP 815" /LENGTH=259 /DNA_ID=CAMNT_0040639019 /DNA_START=14 /DNA_END=790 /DNA_ORIENTATION=+
MCIVAFSWSGIDAESYNILVVHNRDEQLDRKTKRMFLWNDDETLAPQDVTSKGTWFGVRGTSRLSFVTNMRQKDGKVYKTSRGALVTGFLQSGQSTMEYLNGLMAKADEYAGYNLIVFDGKQMGYYCNRTAEAPEILSPGIYALSNDRWLHSSWCKVHRAKELFQDSKARYDQGAWNPMEALSSMLDLMMDTEGVEETVKLPNTGYSLEFETNCSGLFVQPFAHQGGLYGTRTTIALAIHSELDSLVIEKDFDLDADQW